MRLSLLILALMFLVSCGGWQNTLTVTNSSESTVEQVTVQVCSRSYVFAGLKAGESRTQTFVVDGDSGFVVTACLADGTGPLTNGFGYVTGGAGAHRNHAEITITKERKIVGRQR